MRSLSVDERNSLMTPVRRRCIGAMVAVALGPSCAVQTPSAESNGAESAPDTEARTLSRTLRRAPTSDACVAGEIFCQTADIERPTGCGSGARALNPAAATTISARGDITCALTAGGAVRCWGRNDAGQLGSGVLEDSSVPVEVVGLSSGVVAVSAGCAILFDGSVKCWGANSWGELGNNSTIDSHVPVDVVGMASGARAVSVGGTHACVVTATGGVECWGSNGWGEIGDGSHVGTIVPVGVVGLSHGVQAVSAGSGHTCAVVGAGAVKCWGGNHKGQLGNDWISAEKFTPVDVVRLSSGIFAISAGLMHTCAVTAAGMVKCWGRDQGGLLDDGTPDNIGVPFDVAGISSVVAISAGRNFNF